jgi:alpha-L-rhamnosidase
LLAVDLRCESVREPLGVGEGAPELSWRLESRGRGARQSGWQVQAASSREALDAGQADLWDSGQVVSDESVHRAYGGRSLGTGQRVYWKVRVWDEAGGGSGWSTNASWTMGVVRDEDWLGRWITVPWTNGLPVFRGAFTNVVPVRRAVVHVTGLGHYELFLDGVKVGDRFLDPAWTVYGKTVGYATYDLTEALRRPGRHVFGVMLGKGFYRTRGDRRVHGVDSDRPLKLRLQARLELEDGRVQDVLSDGSWRGVEGPITHSAMLGGEDHDARRLAADWGKPEFDDEGWARAVETDGPRRKVGGACRRRR